MLSIYQYYNNSGILKRKKNYPESETLTNLTIQTA